MDLPARRERPMTGGDVRLLDARWLVYRAFCRWQLGELQPRWVAVQFMGAVEFGWFILAHFAVKTHLGIEIPETPPVSFFLVVFGALYPINWWLVVPETGAMEFEDRFARWPTTLKSLAMPFASVVVGGLVLLGYLKAWTWF
jgi:hypothetical protein